MSSVFRPSRGVSLPAFGKIRLKCALIAFAAIGIWINAARGSIIIDPNGSHDEFDLVSGLNDDNVFTNINVASDDAVGHATFAGGTTDYAFAWGSDGNTLSGSGTMTLSGGHQPEYQAVINFNVSDDMPATVSASLNADPATPGTQPFAQATVQLRRSKRIDFRFRTTVHRFEQRRANTPRWRLSA